MNGRTATRRGGPPSAWIVRSNAATMARCVTHTRKSRVAFGAPGTFERRLRNVTMTLGWWLQSVGVNVPIAGSSENE